MMKLKGNMVIEMIDDVTGEVVERVQEENMVTNAVNHILGLNPMGIFYSVAGEYDTHRFGTITCFPSALT